MPKFVIEREMPGVGMLSDAEVRSALQHSCAVMREMGPRVQWVQRYISGDKTYCIYIAESEQDVLEHAKRAGLPANRVSVVRAIVDPTTAE
jgi:Protein of unknown function (DUF4242)